MAQRSRTRKAAPTRVHKVDVELYAAQIAFRQSKALYRGFCAGIGSGKSWAGAYDLIIRSKPKRLYIVVAPTYKTLKDATFRTFRKIAEDLGYWKTYHKSEFRVELINGAEVLFRSADNPDSFAGPNASGVWLDEASLMSEEAFTVSIGRLREAGEQGWLSATFTPKGRQHWTYDQFATGKSDTELFRARTKDNLFIHSTFADTLARQYTSHLGAQELGGEFLDPAGAMMQAAWFPIVEFAPERLTEIRYWDLAATEPKDSTDPDYTVGMRVGRAPNRGAFYMVDMVRLRGTPAQVEKAIMSTAERDGKGVAIHIEQEPGSSGKSLINGYVRMLAGWSVRADRPSGDKVTRAQAFAAMAENGLVKVVRGAWNKDWLDEVALFPLAKHDDIVDASTGGFNLLVDKKEFRLL